MFSKYLLPNLSVPIKVPALVSPGFRALVLVVLSELSYHVGELLGIAYRCTTGIEFVGQLLKESIVLVVGTAGVPYVHLLEEVLWCRG